jgi:hypothetical protein
MKKKLRGDGFTIEPKKSQCLFSVLQVFFFFFLMRATTPTGVVECLVAVGMEMSDNSHFPREMLSQIFHTAKIIKC